MDSLRKQCRLSFVSLKKCNRSAQIRNKQAREKTQEVISNIILMCSYQVLTRLLLSYIDNFQSLFITF